MSQGQDKAAVTHGNRRLAERRTEKVEGRTKPRHQRAGGRVTLLLWGMGGIGAVRAEPGRWLPGLLVAVAGVGWLITNRRDVEEEPGLRPPTPGTAGGRGRAGPGAGPLGTRCRPPAHRLPGPRCRPRLLPHSTWRWRLPGSPVNRSSSHSEGTWICDWSHVTGRLPYYREDVRLISRPRTS